MNEAEYDSDASLAIQKLYDDPGRATLAERVEELLDLLDTDPTDVRLRRQRMQEPKVWKVTVYGSGADFTFFWDFGLRGQPFVRWAGEY